MAFFLAFLSSLAVFAGVFGPAILVRSLLFKQDITYYQFAEYEVWGVLASALLAMYAVRRGCRVWLFVATTGLWCSLAWPWIQAGFWPEEKGLLRRINDSLSDMASDFALKLNMLEPGWGAWSLGGGALGLTGAVWLTLRVQR